MALRRLKHDWDELQQTPLAGIAAQPLPENLQEWHANLAPESGHFAGLVLHVCLRFPDNYPTDPPKVQLCTGIPHSNVIPRLGNDKNFICIDMLKNFFWMGGEDSSRPYEGWSTAYSVSSILLQVQCFLFDEWAQNFDGRYKNTLWDAVIEEGGHRRSTAEVRRRLQHAQAEAAAFRCNCGHCGHKPWPPIDMALSRIPGVHLVGDVVETVHGKSVKICEVLSDGNFKVEGLMSAASVVCPADLMATLPAPWSLQPPKTHSVSSREREAQAAMQVVYLDESDDSTREGDAEEQSVSSFATSLPVARVPWHDIQVGMELQGRVIREMDFGFFLDCGTPAKGLLRKRGLPKDHLALGSCVKVFVSSFDEAAWRIDLALRAKLSAEELRAKAADASEIAGLVVSLQPYGVFVDIGASKAGLIHVSRIGSLDLSSCRVGDEVNVHISGLEPQLQLSVREKAFRPPVLLLPPEEGGHIEEAGIVSGSFTTLPQALLTRILLHGCNLAELRELEHTSKALQVRASEARSIFWDTQSLRCFHTRARFDDAGCVLGVGVMIVEEDGRKHLTCDFDPISQLAFKQLGVRKGVWRNSISYWLPLAIDSQHFGRASNSLKEALRVLGSGKVAEQTRSFGGRQALVQPQQSFISVDAWLDRRAKKNAAANAKFKAFRAGEVPKTEPKTKAPEVATSAVPQSTFDPALVLDVIPKLMNSQVVLLMKGEIWASQKALSGYMAFHHLLLAICHAAPAVQVELERRIASFMSSEVARVKSKVPNLGEFICLLSASEKYDWNSVAAVLLAEVFDRNVLWLLKKYPNLGELSDTGISKKRLRCTFQAALVSMRLIMFNAWFLNHVAKPAHKHGSSACTAASCTLVRYERTKGVPPRQQIDAVHAAVRSICEVNSWQGYFKALRVQHVDALDLCKWLRHSVLSSLRKRYHRPGHFHRQPKQEEKSSDAYEHLAEKWDN